MKAYQVKFNDYGITIVVANNFSEAEIAFLESGFGGNEVHIKSIIEIEQSTNALLTNPL